MRLNHKENTEKFIALLGSEQRAKAAMDALRAKLGHMVTIKNLFVAVKALEGDREFASQSEGVAILEILRVMGPPAVAKPAAIPARTPSSPSPAKPLNTKAKKEVAAGLLRDYELLTGRKERLAFIAKHRGIFEDQESGISQMALRYLEAGKDIPAQIRAGMHFTAKVVGEK